VLLHGAQPWLLCVNGGESVTADFRQMVVACKDARLVIVDPLRRFHSGEENDSSHMTAVVNAFERITRETGAAVILAHHANQSSVLNGVGAQASAARGSSALSAGVRWQANLSAITDQLAVRYRIPESDRHLFVRLDTPKVNYVSTGEPTILRKNPASGALAVWKPALTVARRSSVRQTVSKVGSQTLGTGQ
jgi:RecA-family ATPase